MSPGTAVKNERFDRRLLNIFGLHVYLAELRANDYVSFFTWS